MRLFLLLVALTGWASAYPVTEEIQKSELSGVDPSPVNAGVAPVIQDSEKKEIKKDEAVVKVEDKDVSRSEVNSVKEEHVENKNPEEVSETVNKEKKEIVNTPEVQVQDVQNEEQTVPHSKPKSGINPEKVDEIPTDMKSSEADTSATKAEELKQDEVSNEKKSEPIASSQDNMVSDASATVVSSTSSSSANSESSAKFPVSHAPAVAQADKSANPQSVQKLDELKTDLKPEVQQVVDETKKEASKITEIVDPGTRVVRETEKDEKKQQQKKPGIPVKKEEKTKSKSEKLESVTQDKAQLTHEASVTSEQATPIGEIIHEKEKKEVVSEAKSEPLEINPENVEPSAPIVKEEKEEGKSEVQTEQNEQQYSSKSEPMKTIKGESGVLSTEVKESESVVKNKPKADVSAIESQKDMVNTVPEQTTAEEAVATNAETVKKVENVKNVNEAEEKQTEKTIITEEKINLAKKETPTSGESDAVVKEDNSVQQEAKVQGS